MLSKKDKKNILLIRHGEKSSRFVVDLKIKEESGEDKIKNNKSIFNLFLEKAEDFNFKEEYKKIKIFTSGFFKKYYFQLNEFKSIFLKFIIDKKKLQKYDPEFSSCDQAYSKFIKIKDEYSNYFEKMEQLAIFNLFQFLFFFFLKLFNLFFRFLYKLCYTMGWIALFLIRFFLLIVIWLAKIFFKILNFIFNYFSGLFYKNIFNIKSVYKKISIDIVPLFKIIKEKKIRFKNFVFSFSVFNFKNKNLSSKGINKIEYDEIKALQEKEHAVLKTHFLKHAFSFTLILFIFILPFKAFDYYKRLDIESLKGKVLGASEMAVDNLISASQSASEFNFNQAGQDFSKAGQNFLKAKDQLNDINRIFFSLAKMAPQEEIRMASESKKILEAGETASILGNNLSLAISKLLENKNIDIVKAIDDFIFYGKKAIEDVNILDLYLNKIDANVFPEEYKEQFIELKDKIKILESGLVEFVGIVEKAGKFLGVNNDKRYLLIFQNNNELRASGGFIGSYALVDFRDGKIRNIEVPEGGGYDTEGGLSELVASPEPLHLVNPLWHFWDANWWPDWPTTARKLMWFYEKSDGSTVDGVISFTPNIIEDLLKIIGPIDMSEDYGVIIDSENFWITVQNIVEEKPIDGGQSKPKKIIGDLMNIIIEDLPSHLDNRVSLINFLSLIERNLLEKHMLFYFNDEELQKEILSQGWGGEIKNTNWDYLSVINTNIAGGKSDKRMKETINHVAEIMPNGTIIDTVKIQRTHTGIKNEPFCGVRNVDWMRIYVPRGSELLEAQGFKNPDDIYFEDADPAWEKDPLVYQAETTAKTDELSGTKIYNENDKTVFANWSMVDPGETSTIYLRYKLPFILEKNEDMSFIEKIKKMFNPAQKELVPYAILAQKQPGSQPSKINLSLKLAYNFKIVWKYPESLSIINGGWHINDELNTDKYWAALLEIN